MKAREILLLAVLVGSLTIAWHPQQTAIRGAWQLTNASGAKVIVTIADNYLMQTTYEPNRYISTRGGSWQQTGNKLNLAVEFDTQDSNRVGQTEPYQITQRANELVLSGPAGNLTFKRIDEPASASPLVGLWRITGRANDAGQITTMQRGSRKTLKLLTGSRFQWAAINPQTKQFFGTGGGTYVLKDGQYTETIDFFSRDNDRVGKSLTFNTEVNGTEWHHTGQSSTGGKVNEIWSREK